MSRAIFDGTAIIGLLLLAGGAACSSSDATEDLGPISIHPAALFTAYDDGTADYKVPATLVNVPAGTIVKWTVVDANLATVTTAPPADGKKASSSDSHHATVLTTKAGKTTLRASAGGKTYDVPLTITQYDPAVRELGNDLYQLDRSTQSPDNPGTKAFGCIGCHGNQGTAKHSPSEVGGFDDGAVLKVIATGVKPDGSIANKGAHKFVLDDTEKPAILARIRSLEPLDFAK